jgi:hypothetical protein
VERRDACSGHNSAGRPSSALAGAIPSVIARGGAARRQADGGVARRAPNGDLDDVGPLRGAHDLGCQAE